MLIVLDEKTEHQKLTNLKETLTEKIKGNQKWRGKEKNKILHIKGMDVKTTNEEIVEDINKAIGKNTGITVLSLRQGYRETKNATITVSGDAAAKLTGLGKITIGLCQYRISERIQVPTCYRCLEAGHTVKTCKGPERSDMCRKCGDTNHKADRCDKEMCFTCGVNTHRTNTTRCPEFRKLIKKQERYTKIDGTSRDVEKIGDHNIETKTTKGEEKKDKGVPMQAQVSEKDLSNNEGNGTVPST